MLRALTCSIFLAGTFAACGSSGSNGTSGGSSGSSGGGSTGNTSSTGGTGGGTSTGSTGGGDTNTSYGNGTVNGGSIDVTITNLPIQCAILGSEAQISANAQGGPVLTTSGGVTNLGFNVSISLTTPAAQTYNDGPSSGGTISFNYKESGSTQEYENSTTPPWTLALSSYEVGNPSDFCIIHGTLTATLTGPSSATGSVNMTF